MTTKKKKKIVSLHFNVEASELCKTSCCCRDLLLGESARRAASLLGPLRCLLAAGLLCSATEGVKFV